MKGKRMKLTLERKNQPDSTHIYDNVLTTPDIEEEYWTYRVKLSDTQAVLGFPKFFTTGIGFAVEEDWNINLPWTSDATDIFSHIRHNKGDDSIPDEDVISAIRMIQEAVRLDHV